MLSSSLAARTPCDRSAMTAEADCDHSQTTPSWSASRYHEYSGSTRARYGPYPAAFASAHVANRGSKPELLVVVEVSVGDSELPNVLVGVTEVGVPVGIVTGATQAMI